VAPFFVGFFMEIQISIFTLEKLLAEAAGMEGTCSAFQDR